MTLEPSASTEEFAPEFPEPYFALAHLMQRLGRNEEAQHFMAQVRRRDRGRGPMC